jgi:hypothetical protein
MLAIGDTNYMLYYPYNSEADPQTGLPDRLYDSQDWADERRQFIGDGVYPNPSGNLLVESMFGSMVLTLRKGAAFIKGRTYVQHRDFEFAVNPAHLTLGRRDIVVLRHDIVARTLQPFYVAGEASPTPRTPALVRIDDMFDLQLCQITVNANATAITPAQLLDTRPNNAVCGFVTGQINQVDTSRLFTQYEAALTEMLNRLRAYEAGQIQLFDGQLALTRSLIAALETHSFSLVNHNFDDWSVQRGCEKTTTFNPDNTILERIVVLASGFELARRLTRFFPNGDITETLTFQPWTFQESNIISNSTAISLTKTTSFLANGSIKEAIV